MDDSGGGFPGGSDAGIMDLDLVDELLLGGGCWLETTTPTNIGSDNFFHNNSSPSLAFIDSPYNLPWPFTDSRESAIPSQSNNHNNNQKSTGTTTTTTAAEDKETSYSNSELTHHHSFSSTTTAAIIDSQIGTTPIYNNNSSATATAIVSSSSQFTNQPFFHSELNKIFYIPPPHPNPTQLPSVTRRLLTALTHIQRSSGDRDVLVQIWVPVDREDGSKVLTTANQPFTLDSRSPGLIGYRTISEGYQFPAEDERSTTENYFPLGLPGRVFVGKVPEWTPDVRFFRTDEYPRVIHAQEHGVRGTLALPVFEQGSRKCLGVIEVVLTTQKVSYRPELENVCKALEAVNLRSTEIPDVPKAKDFSSSTHLPVLPEIMDVLRSACESHNLPLAQTWAPCIQHGNEGCRHSDNNLLRCVSTIDDACFVANPRIQGFHKACSEHHLLKGQGVVGKAFLMNQPCFCPDITNYGHTEYPLSHHARVFGLCAAVAIRLRSVYTGNADFVLEFFLPVECRDAEGQRRMLDSLSVIIQQVSRSLRVVTAEELKQDSFVSMVMGSDGASPTRDAVTVKLEDTALSPLSSSQEGTAGALGVKQEGGEEFPLLIEDNSSEEMLTEMAQETISKQDHNKMESGCSRGNDGRSDPGFPAGGVSTSAKATERKRSKADKTITLEVLRQHFAGSLKDAASSLGVCPTTLKRICRQHGIKRWPSRKIKKVGHSLQKLQRVIDSVQGASGSFQIDSFYSAYPDLAASKLSEVVDPLSSSTKVDHIHPPHPSSAHHESVGGGVEPRSPRSAVSKSPTSSTWSQSSSSSQCYSSETQNKTVTLNNSARSEEPTSSGGKSVVEDRTLKWARSEETKLIHHSNQEATKPISKSDSQQTFIRNLNSVDKVTQTTLPKQEDGQQPPQRQEGDAWRVKVAYGEENIRFRLDKGWGYKELEQEVVKRFNLNDVGGFHIKYLDDEAEWVLLTCDADLEECIDICMSGQQQTIKLALHVWQHDQSRSSVGSPGLKSCAP